MDLFSCRICLNRPGNTTLCSKFNESTSYRDMIMEFANVKIEFDENLPFSLCFKCLKKVENAFKLKQKIEKSDIRIRKYFNPICKTKSSSQQNDESEVDSRIECDESFNDIRSPMKSDVSFSLNSGKECSATQLNMCTPNADISIAKKKNEETKSGKTCNYIPLSKKYVDSNKETNHFRKRKFKQIKIEGNLEPDEDIRTCKQCGKVFTRSQNLIRHLIVHTGEKPFKCNVCSKEFTQEANLSTHKKIHSGERRFICEICSKQFVTNICLKQHMITHLPDSAKQFKCDRCDKAFHDKRHLKRHKVIHESEKKFVCTDCSKTFHTKFYLTRHYETVHKKIKKHTCTICFKAFSNTGNLAAHFRIHTGEKPYECKYCNARFNQSTPHVRHQQQHIDRGDQKKCLSNNVKEAYFEEMKGDGNLTLMREENNILISQESTVHTIGNM